MNADQARRGLQRHHVDDDRAPVAALRAIPRVSEALHQLDIRIGDADGIPARRRRLAREAVAGHRRNHEVKRVRRAAAMRRGIGQRPDDLHLLDDRSGPSMRHEERQRILMLRADMNEMDVQSVDIGDEVRQGVELRLDLSPVVFRLPMLRELLDRRELHALRRIPHRLPVGPSRRLDASAQLDEIRFRNVDAEGTDRVAFSCFRFAFAQNVGRNCARRGRRGGRLIRK